MNGTVLVDVPLCLKAGQSFGWKQENGFWWACEGKTKYRLDDFMTNRSISSGGAEAISRLFGMADKDRNDRILRSGPEVEACIEALPGLRLMNLAGTVQTLFSFLCTPNNNIKRIEQLVDRLFKYGEPVQFENQALFHFPNLERIATVSESELRDQKFGYRAASIPRVARELLIRGGENYLNRLKSLTYPEVLENLIDLPGVGPKLADCIALFALGKSEAVPFDVHMWRAYKRTYGLDLDLPLNQGSYRKAGEHLRDRFGRDAGAAHQFMYCFEMMALSKG